MKKEDEVMEEYEKIEAYHKLIPRLQAKTSVMYRRVALGKKTNTAQRTPYNHLRH